MVDDHELAVLIARGIFEAGNEPLEFGGVTQRIQFMGGTWPNDEKAMGGFGERALTECIERLLTKHRSY